MRKRIYRKKETSEEKAARISAYLKMISACAESDRMNREADKLKKN